MTEPDDLLGEIIAQVAREHGVALSRDDPILATVFLNQAILRRMLDQATGPAVSAIAEATRDAVAHLQQHAETQAQWIEQVTLTDRSNLLEQQKTLLEGWQADMQRIVTRQNAGLERVVQAVVKQLGSEVQKLRAQGTPALPCPCSAYRCGGMGGDGDRDRGRHHHRGADGGSLPGWAVGEGNRTGSGTGRPAGATQGRTPSRTGGSNRPESWRGPCPGRSWRQPPGSTGTASAGPGWQGP